MTGPNYSIESFPKYKWTYLPYKYAIQIDYIKAFMHKPFLSLQLFKVDEKFQVFALGASGLGLISSTRFNDRKNIESVKSVWSVLQLEFKAHVLPYPL